jgi:hypothetical protein
VELPQSYRVENVLGKILLTPDIFAHEAIASYINSEFALSPSSGASATLKYMKAPDTPERSGQHRRWGRPFSELSAFSVTVGLAVVLLALAAFLAVLVLMKRAR